MSTTQNEKRSDKKGKDVPPCPGQEALPPARCVWDGFLPDRSCKDPKPCRIVCYYEWTLFQDSDDWFARAQYVYEKANCRDAMGTWTFARASLDEVPAEFFQEVIRIQDELHNKADR